MIGLLIRSLISIFRIAEKYDNKMKHNSTVYAFIVNSSYKFVIMILLIAIICSVSIYLKIFFL